MKLDRFLSHTGLNRIQLHIRIPYRRFSILQRFQTFQTGTLLGTSRTASSLRPFQFHTKNTLSLSLTGKFHLLALRFQLQEFGIIRLICIKISMRNLQDLIGNSVKEISVMSNHDHNALKASQKILKPSHHLIVQMVSRLVQKQHITRIYQSPRQRHSLLLTSGEMIDLLLMICDPQLIQNISGFTLCAPVLLPFPLGHIIQDRRPLRKFRHLRQICDTQTILRNDLSLIRLLQPRNNLKDRRFPGSIDPDNTNLITLMDSIRNIVQDHFLSKYLRNMLYVQNIHK